MRTKYLALTLLSISMSIVPLQVFAHHGNAASIPASKHSS
jgi:hypothetical protein